MTRKQKLLSLGFGILFAGAVAFLLPVSGLLVAWHIALNGGTAPQVEKRPQKYPELLAKWSEAGLGRHFPRAIPGDATNFRLSSFPGFLQGGAWLQIRFNVPAPQAAAAFADAATQAKAHYDGGDIFNLVNENEDGLPGTSFYTSGSDDVLFPDDYRIFVFSARDAGEMWNHGDSSGMVVSLKRNEVIYFAESW